MNRGTLTAALALGILCLDGDALGQSQAESAVFAPSAPSTAAVLRVGTEVIVRLSETLTTKEKQARVGQRFRIEVAEDVKVDDHVVIPVGSTGMGEITNVKNKGMWGQSGHLNARLLYVQVAGRQIRLSGAFDEKGTTGTAGVVAAVVILPVAGFFATGTSATLPAGTVVKGFIDEDVVLAFAAAAPTPLIIPVPGIAPTSTVP